LLIALLQYIVNDVLITTVVCNYSVDWRFRFYARYKWSCIVTGSISKPGTIRTGRALAMSTSLPIAAVQFNGTVKVGTVKQGRCYYQSIPDWDKVYYQSILDWHKVYYQSGS